MDELAAVLRGPIAEESAARLALFQKATGGEIYPLEMGPGYREPVPTKPIKLFVGPRWQSIDDQLAGRATGAMINR